MDWLKNVAGGKMTYVVAVAMICYALGGFLSEKIGKDEAIRVAMEGAGFLFLRRGVGKVEEKVS